MPERFTNATLATIIAAILGVAGLLSIAVWTGVLGAMVGIDDRGSGAKYIVSTIAVGPGAATVLGLYLIGAGRGLDYIDLRWPTVRDAGYAVGGATALLALNVVADVLLDLFEIDAARHNLVAAAESDPGLLLVLLPLAYASVGAGEELLFRNGIQKTLYDTFSRGGAIVVASAVFAAVHFFAYAGLDDPLPAVLVSLVLVFVLSLVLGFVYERTENLLVTIFAHGSFDAAVYVILYVEIAGLPV